MCRLRASISAWIARSSSSTAGFASGDATGAGAVIDGAVVDGAMVAGGVDALVRVAIEEGETIAESGVARPWSAIETGSLSARATTRFGGMGDGRARAPPDAWRFGALS